MSVCVLLLCVALVAAGPSHGGASCTQPLDCSLGGECVDGACSCDAWRTGEDCSQLNMLPSRPGRVQVFPEDSWSSWGAQVIYVNGTYHMYSARMGNRCGLNSWWCNSEVVHAEAAMPDGPFVAKETLVMPFAHNPAVAVASDGTIVIYHIGAGGRPNSQQLNCTDGTSGAAPDITKAVCGAHLTTEASEAPTVGEQWASPNIAFSKSPAGPWEHQLGGGSWGADNPAPVFLENGTVLVYAKFRCNATLNDAPGACYQYGLLTAPHWRGPYSFVRRIEVFGEDVVAWRDQRGNYHMILQGGPYMDTTSSWLQNCRGHMHTAWSQDGLDWTLNCRDAGYADYPNFPLTDGTVFKVRRRERQYVLLSREHQPLWWYNGVAGNEYDKQAGTDHTYSTAQPFNTSAAQLHEPPRFVV